MLAILKGQEFKKILDGHIGIILIWKYMELHPNFRLLKILVKSYQTQYFIEELRVQFS